MIGAGLIRRGAPATLTTRIFAHQRLAWLLAVGLHVVVSTTPLDSSGVASAASDSLIAGARNPSDVQQVLQLSSPTLSRQEARFGLQGEIATVDVDSRGQARLSPTVDDGVSQPEASLPSGFASGAGSPWMRQLGIVAERNRQLQAEVAALKAALEQLSNETLARRQAIADTEKEAAEERRRAAEADVAKAAAATAAAAQAARAAEAERLASAQASEAVQRALEEKRQSLAAELEAARRRQGAAEAELAAAQAEVAHVDSRTRQLGLEVRASSSEQRSQSCDGVSRNGGRCSELACPCLRCSPSHFPFICSSFLLAAASGARADCRGYPVPPRSRVGCRGQASRA